MPVIRMLNRLVSSPLNRDRRVAALWRFAKWQLGSRLVPGHVMVDWVEGTHFIAGPGDRGLTGNVYLGLHEFHDMAYVLHVLQPADWFVDVGANAGSYTILACAAAGAQGYCFEPVPQTYQKLVMNLAVNKLVDRVKHFNQGVGDRRDVLRFTSGEDCTNHVLANGEASPGAVEVPVAPLDECVSIAPSMMKIDVEGYETMVLRGASRILNDPQLHSLLIELNGSGARYGFDEGEILSTLEAVGFRPYQYDGLTRQLAALDKRCNASGNTLFIRDVELARRRIASARKYRIQGKSV